MTVLLVLLLLPFFVFSSGFMEIRLKSAFRLNAKVETAENIYFPENKKTYNLTLTPNDVYTLSNIPVKFGSSGIVLVNSGPVEKFELLYVTMESERWNTEVVTICRDKIFLPFLGFRIDIKCNRNWHGQYCANFCNDDHALTLMNRRCTENGDLACPRGFSGSDCSKPINQTSSNCLNGGELVSIFPSVKDPEDVLICECPKGFEGKQCQTKSYKYEDPVSLGFHGNRWDGTLLSEFLKNSEVDNEFCK